MGRGILPLLGGVVVAVALSGCAAVPDEGPAYSSGPGCVTTYPEMAGYYYGPDCYPAFYGGIFIDHGFHRDHDFRHDHDHDFHHGQTGAVASMGGHMAPHLAMHRGSGVMLR
jgi:hypothetical protein